MNASELSDIFLSFRAVFINLPHCFIRIFHVSRQHTRSYYVRGKQKPHIRRKTKQSFRGQNQKIRMEKSKMENKSNNKIVVPEAKAAMEQFKMQAANEVGVQLNANGYNGQLTSREAGSIGGQMVKKMTPVRTAIPGYTTVFTRTDRTAQGHTITVKYIASVIL